MMQNIATTEMIYYFFCEIEALQLIIFQAEGPHEVTIRSM